MPDTTSVRRFRYSIGVAEIPAAERQQLEGEQAGHALAAHQRGEVGTATVIEDHEFAIDDRPVRQLHRRRTGTARSGRCRSG
jgi:hypothetical protein